MNVDGLVTLNNRDGRSVSVRVGDFVGGSDRERGVVFAKFVDRFLSGGCVGDVFESSWDGSLCSREDCGGRCGMGHDGDVAGQVGAGVLRVEARADVGGVRRGAYSVGPDDRAAVDCCVCGRGAVRGDYGAVDGVVGGGGQADVVGVDDVRGCSAGGVPMVRDEDKKKGQFRRGPNFDKNQAKRDRRRDRKRAVRQQGECGKPVWKSVRVEARRMEEAAKVLAHGDVTVQRHGPNHARNVANREAQKVVRREEEQQRKLEWQKMKDVAAMARENRCSSCVMCDDRCVLCQSRFDAEVAVNAFRVEKAAADLEQLKKARTDGSYLWKENRVGRYVEGQRVATVLSTAESRQSTPESVPSLRSGSLTPGSSASVPRTVAAVADVFDDLIVNSGQEVVEVVKTMEKAKLMKFMPEFVRDAVVEKYGIYGFFDSCETDGLDGFGSEEFYD